MKYIIVMVLFVVSISMIREGIADTTNDCNLEEVIQSKEMTTKLKNEITALKVKNAEQKVKIMEQSVKIANKNRLIKKYRFSGTINRNRVPTTQNDQLQRVLSSFQQRNDQTHDLLSQIARLEKFNETVMEFVHHENQVQVLQGQMQTLMSEFSDLKSQLNGNNIAHMSCPSGFTRHGHSCYRYINDILSWPGAVTFCQAFGSHLVVIETHEEHNYLKQMMREGAYRPNYGVWIAASDAYTGEYVWAGTGKPATNLSWGPGEPNAVSPGNCLDMYADHGYDLSDDRCSYPQNFMCEIDLAA